MLGRPLFRCPSDHSLAGDPLLRRMPVFGTGLNIQATTIAAYRQEADWRELLVKVSREVLLRRQSLDLLPRTHLPGIRENLMAGATGL
jgi:hypothetical protein